MSVPWLDITKNAPPKPSASLNLANYLLALQRFDEAHKAIQEAHARQLDGFVLHAVLYAVGFLEHDSSAMATQQRWFADSAGVENIGLSLTSDTEAYAGHLAKARQATNRSVASAIQEDNKENGAIWWENAALREAAFGNFVEARNAAAAGLKLAPNSQGVGLEAALAYAMSGDQAQAQRLVRDLNDRYPLDTQVQGLWLPAVQAQLAISRKDSSMGIAALQGALPPLEYGQITFVANISCLYPTFFS